MASHLLGNVVVFGRLLRTLGLDVHTGRLLDVIAALEHVDLGARDDVYHTCRTLLVHRREELGVFDRAFDAFWRTHPEPRRAAPSGTGAPVRPADLTRADRAGGDPSDGAAPPRPEPAGRSAMTARADVAALPAPDAADALQPTWSHAAALARKDFAQFSPDEVLVARTALDRLVWSPGERRTRRWVAGRGPRIDLRRALSQSLRTGGDIVRLPRERRGWRPRPLVLVCDVSGSMERYSRMLLHFAHALTQRHRRVEAFLFSTRLTRITRALRNPRLDDAMTVVARSVDDWSGGTRTGEALRDLNQRWTRRVLHGGPVVLLISDGWDRGDPLVLRDEVARLQRSCHRLIWLNPLLGTADYAPLTRGLQAALPFVDDFLPARTLTDLTDLAVHLNSLAAPGQSA